jgi:uncharacterized membrane protein YedE/YeeE
MDFVQQDWIYGFVGGLVIGLGAAIYLLVNGRVMGASGILGGLVDGSGYTTAMERLSFIGGLVFVPAAVALFSGAPDTHLTGNWAVLIAAGLLVGIGTRLANGCTSGHGVCGISRFSLRGMVATVFYIGAGGLAVMLFKHILGVI